MVPEILIKDYWYDLPQERIAAFPLSERDQSKLLVYKNGEIGHSQFTEIASHLPIENVLFFNNTRVIPARLLFKKDTGATIELFLLSPVKPSNIVQQAMEANSSCQWLCIIGNLKRWTKGLLLKKQIGDLELSASLVDSDTGIVEFKWQKSNLNFAEVITLSGQTPLPPYLNREVAEIDSHRYQTVYSRLDGAVAAPTAGLHFTDSVMSALKDRNQILDFLTLHVSAGTFQPVKVENAMDHPMHREQVIVTRTNIENILSTKTITAVGTTSLRTLESLYWYGVKLAADSTSLFSISQHDPYKMDQALTLKESVTLVKQKMELEGTEFLSGETSIMIVPGYRFKVVDVLITNFHQPGSTLMLLVAAFTGGDWKKIYQEALSNNYRFLSYGDSSILFRTN